MSKTINMVTYGAQDIGEQAILKVTTTNGEATSVVAQKDGMAVRLEKASVLPSGYTQLEYIESTGTQYINTGYVPTGNTKAQATMMCLQQTTWESLFGSDSDTFCIQRNNGTVYFCPAYFGTTYWESSDIRISVDINQQYVFTLDALSGKFSVGNTTLNISKGTTNPTMALTILRKANEVLCGVLRVYLMTIWDSSTLVRNMYPAKRNSDGVLGMYDTVNNVFYTNSGTGSFVAGPEIKWIGTIPRYGTWTVVASNSEHMNSKEITITAAQDYNLSITMPDVPIGYTQLEWISSTGAYINTNYSPVSSCRVFMKAQDNTSGTVQYDFFDSQYFGSPYKLFLLEFKTDSSSSVMTYYNSAGTNAVFNISAARNTTYTISTSGRSVTINGTTYSISGGSAITTASGISMNFGNKCKTWYFQMTNSGGSTLVRNMVPAKRLSDNEVGMWDKVNNVFYASANSSKFTAGPAI